MTDTQADKSLISIVARAVFTSSDYKTVQYLETNSELQQCYDIEDKITHKQQTWIQSFRGIISLQKKYEKNIIDLACKRALEFKIYEYHTVKNIFNNGLYNKKKENLSIDHVKT